jgi:hypothetical protein
VSPEEAGLLIYDAFPNRERRMSYNFSMGDIRVRRADEAVGRSPRFHSQYEIMSLSEFAETKLQFDAFIE